MRHILEDCLRVECRYSRKITVKKILLCIPNLLISTNIFDSSVAFLYKSINVKFSSGNPLHFNLIRQCKVPKYMYRHSIKKCGKNGLYY